MSKPSIFLLLALSLSPHFSLSAQDQLVGKSIPEVTAYDESGAPFSLHDKLKGNYSVIVFGCLT